MQFGGPQNVDSGEDDMIFCIPLQPSSSGLQFVAVRRLATGLPRQIAYGGPLYRSTDWRLSVHLNIVMHSQFRLSIKALRCATATSAWPWDPLGVPHLVCPTWCAPLGAPHTKTNWPLLRSDVKDWLS
jgi:hypothetical protein